jgi:predicted acetyltransferase
MGLILRWVGEDELDRVAQTRMYCYGAASKELETYTARIRDDQRTRPGDFLLAERAGVAVGTTTSISFHMWCRGGRIPCQGVAWVGTIKTARRSGKTGGEKGIASQLMHETIRKARERGEVVSALMPFRASFYEHFGYGMVERRNDWSVPISILPQGDFQGIRFMQAGDLPLVQACRQRMVEQGQCDLERTPGSWAFFSPQWENGYCIVDQPTAGGAVGSWAYLVESIQNDLRYITVADAAWDSPQALVRQLHFLASLRDQYSEAILTLPVDWPLNWLLKESQLPHRPVDHAVAKVQTINRTQLRILDHAKFLSALMLPPESSGKATIGVRESEGDVSSFAIDLEKGHARHKPSAGSPDVEMTDRTWAAIACGDLPASTAARLGLIRVHSESALKLLDAFAIGPAPFCNERF